MQSYVETSNIVIWPADVTIGKDTHNIKEYCDYSIATESGLKFAGVYDALDFPLRLCSPQRSISTSPKRLYRHLS